MNYLVLARRTRPQSLNELIGQDPTRDALKGMLESKKIPHAFLFAGTRGTGKTSTARILAKSLNCENGPTVTPCQICRHCVQITACSHEDVFEVDAASNTGVDNIRELRESTRFYPVSARYKIFVIDEVHMLSGGAFNALLKTLEEPPEHVVFILATTELHKIPATIRSRCVSFAFKKIDSLVIADHLKVILKNDEKDFEPDAITLIAREAQGSLRDALSLLEQALALQTGPILTCAETKTSLGLQNAETGFLLFSMICQRNQTQALDILQNADNAGLDLSLLCESAANYFRFAILLKSTASQNLCGYLLNEERTAIMQATQQVSTSTLSEIFKLLAISVRDIQRASNALSWAEVIVMDAINRADWLSASDFLFQLQKSQPAQPPLNIQSNKIDLELYRQFIAIAKKRSQTLGARLSFVQLEEFNRNRIKFAHTAENAAYLAFDQQDQQSFQESLKDMGLWEVMTHDAQGPDKFVSLNEIQETEKKKAFSLKEKEILSRESVKNLMILSKEIKLTPIEN